MEIYVYLMPQVRIFGFQKTNTINETGQTVVQILQLSFLYHATVARWTKAQNRGIYTKRITTNSLNLGNETVENTRMFILQLVGAPTKNSPEKLYGKYYALYTENHF